jgi:hypothetical protein
VQVKVDWAKFLVRHDFVWDQPPPDWWSGAFVGNGVIGAMIYRGDETSFRWDVGRSDVYDHQPSKENDWLSALWFRARLPVGSFRLRTQGRILDGSTARLDLWNAEVRGVIVTDRGSIEWRSLAHATEQAIGIELRPSPGEIGCQWEWEPAEARTTRTRKPPHEPYLGNPPGARSEESGASVWRQPLRAGGEYVTAWRETKQPERRELWLSVGYTRKGEARAAPVRAITSAAARGWVAMAASHRAWWHDFFPQHFLSVPDSALERFYWQQIYKLGSAMRADGPLCDLFGPWFKASEWPGLWWNLNVQFTYYPIYAANLPSLGESLTRALDGAAAALRENAGDRPDRAAIGRASGSDLRATVRAEPFETGNLPWALHNYWQQYRATMDDTMLRERLLPLLRRSANYYLSLLAPGADGHLHLPATLSPEFGPTRDSTYDLALLRWELETLLATDDRLGLRDPQATVWRETLARLVPWPMDGNGFRVGADLSFDRSHHHYSHLLAIFPLRLVTWDDPAQRALIETSVDRYIGLGHGAYQNVGAAALYASMGRGDRAWPLLQEYVATMTTPNTFAEGDGNACIEAPLHFNRSLQEMVLQSWGGVIRVFPAIPAAWAEVAIHSMRTEGAFLVSAARAAGRTQFVQITSLAGEPCAVRTDLLGPVTFEPQPSGGFTQRGDGVIVLGLRRGETVALRAADFNGPGVIAPVATDVKR